MDTPVPASPRLPCWRRPAPVRTTWTAPSNPLSWGKVHPDVISMQQMMKADGFQVKDINMDAYMEVRRLTQEFIDDFLGYWINPTNAQMSSLLVGCGLPGGMMGSMMADLKGFESAINAAQRAHGRPEMSMDTLMVKLFDEVEYVWPRLGYPPLVTPFSQYVKNTALMNLFNMVNDKPRWTTIDKDTWGMILGKMGKLPGELAPEIVALAKEKGMEFYTGNHLRQEDGPSAVHCPERRAQDRSDQGDILIPSPADEETGCDRRLHPERRIPDAEDSGTDCRGPFQTIRDHPVRPHGNADGAADARNLRGARGRECSRVGPGSGEDGGGRRPARRRGPVLGHELPLRREGFLRAPLPV